MEHREHGEPRGPQTGRKPALGSKAASCKFPPSFVSSSLSVATVATIATCVAKRHGNFAHEVLPDKLPDVDNEGRPYNLKLVVVNFNNVSASQSCMQRPRHKSQYRRADVKVGTSFGMLFNQDKEPKYNWEGVRRCDSWLRW